MAYWSLKPKQSFAEEHAHWIGKTMVAAVTKKISYGQQAGMTTFIPYVMDSETISGKVSAVTNKCVQIDDKWYELDATVVGGIRVIEVI